MSEETLVEPGGWLAEHQRAHCAGASPLTTYQGLICDEIVLPQSADAAEDPAQLVLAANAFVDAAQNQALLIIGEFAPEAVWSRHAHDYITQAKTGGHAQYYALHGGDAVALRGCASALKSMLADPHLEIFNLMLRLKRNKPREARRIATQAGYASIAVALRALDKRLIDLEQKEPLAPRHKAWLKSYRKLKIAPDAELGQHMQRLAQANPLYAARRAEADRIRAEAQRNDPAYKAVRTLCDMAGLKFAALGQGAYTSMRSVWPEGPERNAFGFRVETDRGPRAALFYTEGGLFKRRLAVLLQPGENLPLGSLSLSRADYEAIVPAKA
jgi:hypothetical protein